MSYIGNIGALRKSIYVKGKSKRCKSLKEKLKNKNVVTGDTRKQYREFIKDIFEYTPTVQAVTIEEKLNFIRKQFSEEINIHGKQTKIDEGFVYIIVNDNYPGWIKAGMTVDYEKRLATYNLYDPTSCFKIMCVKWVKNRRLIEKILLDELSKILTNRKGEWFEIDVDKATLLFNN